MACWILAASDDNYPGEKFAEFAVFADSVTEVAFGPLIRPSEDGTRSAIEQAQDFASWLQNFGHADDPRRLTTEELIALYSKYLDTNE